MPTKALIVGGTRGTGRLVAQSLNRRGHGVRVLARDVARARAALDASIEIVHGDITRPDTLPAALRGVDHIVFTAAAPPRPAREATIKTVDYGGVRHTLSAAAAAGFTGRFVYMSSIGVATPSLVASLLNTIKWNALVWRKRAEDDVRASGLAYTVVRAGFLVNGPAGRRAVDLGQRELPLTLRRRISRGDVAEAIAQALEHRKTVRTTFEIVWGPGAAAQPWPVLFDTLRADA